MATLGGDGSGMYTKIAPGGTLLSDADLEVYASAFEKTGSTGAFNWYRALDLNWEDARALGKTRIEIPTLMITAENDLILVLRRRSRCASTSRTCASSSSATVATGRNRSARRK